jgi:hypothetical protein
MAGMFGGVLVTGLFFDGLSDFYASTPWGSVTVSQWLDLPYGVVALVVVAMALGGFAVAERLERRA